MESRIDEIAAELPEQGHAKVAATATAAVELAGMLVRDGALPEETLLQRIGPHFRTELSHDQLVASVRAARLLHELDADGLTRGQLLTGDLQVSWDTGGVRRAAELIAALEALVDRTVVNARKSRPQVAVGDWIEVLFSPTALTPMEGSIVEVTSVFDDGRTVGVIAGGRLATTLQCEHGDRWQLAAEPENIPPTWIRSSAAPEPEPPSYADRPAPTNPALAEVPDETGEFCGWMQAEGVSERHCALVDVAVQHYDENGVPATPDTIDWELYRVADRDCDDTDLLALELGNLLLEADQMSGDHGFVYHNYFPELELRIYDELHLKGLERVVELISELGGTVHFEREED